MKTLLISFLCLASIFCFSQEETTNTPTEVSTSDTINTVDGFMVFLRGNTKAVLNWQFSGSEVPEYFTIERGSNGKMFEVIALLKQTPGARYEWIDDSPAKGKNSYRISFMKPGGQQMYSKIVSLFLAGDISFRFFPNPVDNALIIRSEFPVDLQIVDGSGKIRISLNRIKGLYIINVSSLEKGIYLLRINNQLVNYTLQEKLLKN